MNIRDYGRVLWDFNGTLLDDIRLCMDTVNDILVPRGLAPIADHEAYRRIFGFPVKEYYARLGLPSEGENFVTVANEWISAYRAGEHTAPLRDGVQTVLDAIHAAGVPQGVLSATESVMLSEQIANLGIAGYFDRVLGRNDIYAVDKSDIAARYAEEHPEERVLMLGDTDHDFLTAMAGGFDCILIAGGHQSREALDACGCPVAPDFDSLRLMLSL